MEIQDRSRLTFTIKSALLEGRRDVGYYNPARLEVIESLQRSPFPIKKLRDVAKKRRERIDPQSRREQEFSYIDLASIAEGGEIIKVKKVKGRQLRSQKNKFYGGDILFSKIRMYLNKVVLVPDEVSEGVCSTEFVVFKPFSDVNDFFLRHILTSNFVLNQAKYIPTGSLRPRASERDLENLRLPIPPKSIQDKIATKMQDAFEKRRQNLQKATELAGQRDAFLIEQLNIQIPKVQDRLTYWVSPSDFESRRDSTFYHPKYTALIQELHKSSYEIKTIKEISQKIVDGPFVSQLLVSEYVDEGVPLLRVHNVKEDEINFDNMVFITQDKQEQLKRSRVNPGDLVLTKAGTIGVAAVVPEQIKEANITSHLAKIELVHTNPHYVSIFLNSQLGRLQVERWGHKTTRPELNLSEVSSIKILIPPKEVQDKIAEKVKGLREKAKRLMREADEVIRKARKQVEGIILGEAKIDSLEEAG